ncbi:MAG: TolC family protein [PS1 clade bacterium]|nr:TolC family protein [PS1 clade bacterium]
MSGVHQPKGNWLKANCPKRNWVNPVSALFALVFFATGPARADDMASGSPVSSPSVSSPPVSAPRAIAHQLDEIFVDHPQVQSARQNACEASYTVLYGKSAYYPQLDASISGRNKLIDETTRSDEYGGRNSPEYDGKGVNATLSLRQNLYDWGRTDATVSGAKSDHAAALIRADLTLNEKIVEFYELALQFVMQDMLAANFATSRDLMQKDLETAEAHYKSGTARLSTLRQANIHKLDIDAQLSLAERQRDITRQTLKTKFTLGADDIRAAVVHFRANRPDIPEVIEATRSLEASLLRQNIRAARAEYRRLRAERLPAFQAVLTGRAWDINESNRCGDTVSGGHPDALDPFSASSVRGQNCTTHELVGAVEFSMPLYDGGASQARRMGVSARQRGLELELDAQIRAHTAETRSVQNQLLDLLSQIDEQTRRIGDLREQVDSERILQARTRAEPVGLMRLQLELARAEARLISLDLQSEAVRLRGLSLANALANVLGISTGESGC